jgi:hypothetical protein
MHLAEEDYAPLIPGERVDLRDFEASLCYQGQGDDPTHGNGYSLVSQVKRWLRDRTTTTLVFRVARGDEQAVIDAAVKLGGVLVK